MGVGRPPIQPQKKDSTGESGCRFTFGQLELEDVVEHPANLVMTRLLWESLV